MPFIHDSARLTHQKGRKQKYGQTNEENWIFIFWTLVFLAGLASALGI